MILSLIPKAVGHSLLRGLSLGFILAGLPPSAQAVVYPGTDYLITPPGGATYYYKLPGGAILPFSFGGLPIGSPTPNGALFSPTAPPTGGPASQIPNPFPPPAGLVTPPNPDGSYGEYVGPMSYIPVTAGKADTVVNRLATVIPTFVSIDPVTGLNTNINPITGLPDVGQATPIEIVGLSLKGGTVTIPAGLPVPGPYTPGTYNIFAGLQKYYGNTTGTGPLSTGTMFIGDDSTNPNPPGPKTWDSKFTLKAMAFGVPVGSTLDTTTVDFVRSTLEGMTTALSDAGPYDCNSTVSGVSYDLLCVSIYDIVDNIWKEFVATNEPWKTVPDIGDLVGENLVPLEILPSTTPKTYQASDFYLKGTARHDNGCDPLGNCTVHIVDAPAPLPVLGAGAAYGFARRLRKRCREAMKAA